MSDTVANRAVLVTWVASPAARYAASLLIDSIRTFGGAFGRCPIWLFEANPAEAPCDALAQEGVEVMRLSVPDALRGYWFASKVCACAKAEALATPSIESLIWFNPDCLVIQPPTLLDLATSFDVAIRPVHIQNVGLLATDPVDTFWQKVYETAGGTDIGMTVESFVDAQRIRAYFNTHAFAVNPSKGLFRRWLQDFETLVRDQAYQVAACQDVRHQIFLHQAALSALVVTSVDSARLRILPPEYSYPYHLHQSVPPDRRASALNDLVCIAYEDRPPDPNVARDVAVREPLRSWLSGRASLIR